MTDNQDDTAEEWREFAQARYARYEVSNLGRIRNARTGRVLVLGQNEDGYVRLDLRLQGHGGPKTFFMVHRLVCITFNGPPPEGRGHALHGNGDRRDNRATNLRWGNAADNRADAVRHGTAKVPPPRRGEDSAKAKLTNEQVLEIRRLAAAREMTHRALAAKFGIGMTTLQRIIYRQMWKHLPNEVSA